MTTEKEIPKVLARLEFVELGWRYTELHLEAMEAHAACRKSTTPQTIEAAKQAWRHSVAYFDAPWEAVPDEFGTVEGLGMAIYRQALVPFEVISITLLVAVIGAIAVARSRTE